MQLELRTIINMVGIATVAHDSWLQLYRTWYKAAGPGKKDVSKFGQLMLLFTSAIDLRLMNPSVSNTLSSINTKLVLFWCFSYRLCISTIINS